MFQRFSMPHQLPAKVNAIMANDCAITRRLLTRQQTMFRMAEKKGFSQKIIHIETGISVTSVSEYARGITAMSGPAILKLVEWREFPSECLSILFDGSGRHVGDDTAAPDFDHLACETSGFTHSLLEAKRDGRLTSEERQRLRDQARRVAAAAANVA